MSSRVTQREERLRGLAFARAWRERMRPYFDALYGPGRCPRCGAGPKPD